MAYGSSAVGSTILIVFMDCGLLYIYGKFHVAKCTERT